MADVTHSTLDADHAWTSTAWSSAIKFDKRTRLLPPQTVASVIAFTVDNTAAKPGAGSYVRLIADGTNAPTFTGMTEDGGSMGYDNRAGIVNKLTFWLDGTDYLYAILQNVAPVLALATLRFGSTAYATESGNSTSGWIYTSTTGVGTGANGPDHTLQSGTDGSFTCTVGTFVTDTSANSPFVGWSDQIAGANAYNDTHFLYGFYADRILLKYVPYSGGAGPTRNGATVSCAIGDVMRSRRVGSTMYCEVSKDAGATWTIIHTYAGVSTARLWPALQMTNPGVAGPLFFSGLS